MSRAQKRSRGDTHNKCIYCILDALHDVCTDDELRDGFKNFWNHAIRKCSDDNVSYSHIIEEIGDHIQAYGNPYYDEVSDEFVNPHKNEAKLMLRILDGDEGVHRTSRAHLDHVSKCK